MIRTIKQEQFKQELQLRYREFFESKLAIDLLKQKTNSFSSVKKISSAIVKLIEQNKVAVLDLLTADPQIIFELQEPYFGSCYDNQQKVTPAECLEKILSILNDENADLKNVMQLHCVFIHRIYDQLEKNPEKAAFVSQIFPDFLFSKQTRSRTELKEKNIKLTTQLGITKNPVFTKMLEQSHRKHSRAIEKYIPDCSATFFKSALEKSIPIVCGPSGHTGSLMLGAKLYGNLSEEQLNEYAFVSFAFLAAGGNHSFHEVMVVAALVGVEYQIDSYSLNMPLSIKKTDAYKKLCDQFPEFLEKNSLKIY